ncbi:MAG: tRNA lysidine(34) synthetase TilS [Bacilli bacterium]|nr:tRNA lysidine(34) synthetase TilS [Bacilli bacterium]
MDLVYNYLKNVIDLQKEDKVVVGVSAGPDSMFLLYVLYELRKVIGFTIIVAHINHNVRVESAEEEEFLKAYCQERDIDFCSMKIEEYGKENFHAYARNIRYDFYHDLIKKYKANYLMTAHHGDDLVETILMRLTRGSNLKGYKGISSVTELDDYKLVRPLLYMTKDEIKELDDSLGIPYRIDKSNVSDKYTRNRYRKYVLPFLKSENQDVHLKFLKFSNLLSDVDNYLEKEVDKVYNDIYVNNCININKFLDIDVLIEKMLLERVLKEVCNDISNITDKHIEMILELIRGNKTGSSINLPSNIKCTVEYSYLRFSEVIEEEDYKFELKDGLVLPNGMKFIKLESKESGNDTLHLDSSMVKLPLYVRNKRDGDFIELKGTNGKRKVSDVFIDCKVERSRRNSYPVVVDSDDKIIWIPKLKKSKYDGKFNELCDIIVKCL